MKWCEHCEITTDGTTRLNWDFGRSKLHEPPFFVWFCPLCGVPRPTLKLRFEHILSGYAARIQEVSYAKWRNQPSELIGLSHQEALNKLVEAVEDYKKIGIK